MLLPQTVTASLQILNLSCDFGILTSLECLGIIDQTGELLAIQVTQTPLKMQKSAVSVKIKMFKLLSLCNQPLKQNSPLTI